MSLEVSNAHVLCKVKELQNDTFVKFFFFLVTVIIISETSLPVCALVGTCAKEGSSSFGMGNGNWGGNGDKE